MTAAGTVADHCWICGSSRVRGWRDGTAPAELRSRDVQITDARYGVTLPLSRCEACGFVFAPTAARLDLTALYAALDDEEYVETGDVRRLQMEAILRRAQRAHPSARTLLDVGAGIGLLVQEARARGLDAVGIEPSQQLAARARDAGTPVFAGTLPHPDLDSRRFDVVTLVDVLEHVTDPVALLRQCADRLADDGRLVVITPDVGSLPARVLRKRWWHFRIAHVGYFTADTVTRTAAAAGLAEQSRGRPVWYLPLGYIVARLQVYLPKARVFSLARAVRPPRRLQQVPIPLDLRDSLLMVFRRPPSDLPLRHE